MEKEQTSPNDSVGRASKYVKYAIGEILLVVIGILIALQINNWNEGRKLKIEECELLSNLELEFNRKLRELEDKNEGRLENIADINKLLKIISDQNDDVPEAEMMTLLENLGTWYYVNEEFSIIEMLFSSGKINTISNDSLKAKLITWPDKMEEMFEEQRVLRDLVVERINPTIQNYVPHTNLLHHFTVKYSESPAQEELIKGRYPNNFRGLIRDRPLESMLASKKLFLWINYNDTQLLISDAKAILELINEEL